MLLSLLAALPAHASIPLVPHCPKEFHDEIVKFGSQDLWTEQAPSPEGYKVFRSPTGTLGQWLELTFDKDHTTVYAMSNSDLTKVSFDKNCHRKETHEKGFDARAKYPDPKANWLDDKELAYLMEKNREGLVYVWSPGMVYSVQFYKRFEEVAKEMNLKFIPVMDHRASSKELEAMAKKMPVPPSRLKLNSVELYMRNVTTHFPGSLVFKNGRLNQDRIIGVMEKSELKNVITQELGKL